MDTTKKNIKMCEKAEEIQEGDYENGDIIFYKGKWGMYFKEYFYEEIVFNNGILIDYVYPPIWLPTQSQLQEMVVGDFNDWKDEPRLAIFHLLEQFNRWSTRGSQFFSMEQLWLAFVMKEKYNKIWDGEEWKIIREKGGRDDYKLS